MSIKARPATRPHPATDLDVALGQHFRRVRRQCGIPLEDLAKRVGVAKNTIRWHEAGARSLRLDVVVRAADAMGCKTSDLIPSRRSLAVRQAAHLHRQTS